MLPGRRSSWTEDFRWSNPTPFPDSAPLLTFPAVPTSSSRWLSILGLLTLACGGKPAAPAPAHGSPAPREPIKPLLTSSLAGQAIALTPITLIVATDSLAQLVPLNDRVVALAWADSIVDGVFLARGAEVKWVLPGELRKLARRAPTVAPDPDRMGQSLMRAQQIKDVPDPLRSEFRSLMALVGGRFIMIPAAISFVPDSSGAVRAELSLVMADTRTGRVVWRTLAWGLGGTPARALTVAMETVLPVGLGLR
jgi:hypothetical protein